LGCNVGVPNLFGPAPQSGCGWASGTDYAACVGGWGPQNPNQYRLKQEEDNCWNQYGGNASVSCPGRGSWKTG
jgi:hypothetical protein